MNIPKWISKNSLNSELQEMEQQLHQRQLLFALQKDSFKQCLRDKLRSPKTILFAAGAGFTLGYLSLRQNNVPAEGKTSRISSLILSVTDVLMLTGSVMALFQHKGAPQKTDTANQNK